MARRVAFWPLVLLLGIVLAGCDSPKPTAQSPIANPPPPPPPPLAGVPDAVIEGPPAGETETVKAEAGVGLKGRTLDPHEGLYVTPAKAYFTAKERIVFDIQVPEALKLYKALEGAAPKSHDEFMEQVIQANQIKLPVLPPGARYVYKPEAEELMVERPVQAQP